jgi:hypothetical protein
MAGWFPESDDERRRRIDAEQRIRVNREKQAKLDDEAKRKKAEKKRKERAEFQEKIDEEVEKHLEALTPESKQSRLESMKASSNLLNAALGLEFASKGERTSTPWMAAPTTGMGAQKKPSEGAESSAAAAATSEASVKTIKLTRPY